MRRRARQKAIRVSFRPSLRALRGRLISGGGRGVEVHAGAFLDRRSIVLDEELLEQPSELARVFIHEMYHFVWRRLGNPTRKSYEDLLAAEIQQRKTGELGDSSERRKAALTRRDVSTRTRRWREYVCESFCDTAAWLATGGRHSEFTLDRDARRIRRAWFRYARPLFRIQL